MVCLNSTSAAGGFNSFLPENSEQPDKTATAANAPSLIANEAARLETTCDSRRIWFFLLPNFTMLALFSSCSFSRSAADSVKFQLNQLTTGAALIGFVQSQLIGSTRFVALVLRHQDIALAVGHGAGELRRKITGQQLERLIIGLGVQQQASQANRRNRLVFCIAAVVDHPLQLLLGGVGIIGIECRLGSHQRAHLRIGGAAKLVLHVGRSAQHLGIVFRLNRTLLLVVELRCLLRLLALVNIPAAPCC